MSTVRLAIVGATGAVGKTALEILAQRKFPFSAIHLLASERSAGTKVNAFGQTLTISNLAEFDFSTSDIAIFSAGGSVSEIYAPKAAKAGCWVVDNTSFFRYQDHIPLVVAEVNGEILDTTKEKIIANPNCSTMQMLVALKPVQDAVGISRINVCSYQAVSGSGAKAIEELREQSRSLLTSGKIDKDMVKAYPVPIAFNCIPQIDQFLANGYTKEEMKMVWETQKIFADKNIEVNPTCVRIPVFFGHSLATHIETKEKITSQEVKALLAKAPGVCLYDDPAKMHYPTPSEQAAGKDEVFVGRIREDISHPKGINMWIVSDNLRKGAALNAIQISELLIKKYF